MAGREKDGKKRSRRWLIVLGLLVVLAAVGWQVFKQFLDIEKYKQIAVMEIERRTGLPASLGQADVKLWPTPRIVVRDVVVGEGDFKFTAKRISAQARLGRLVHGEAEVESITAQDVIIDIPETTEDLQARWEALRTALGGGETSGGEAGGSASSFKVTLKTAKADSFEVRRPSGVVLRGSATVHDALSPAPRADIAVTLPQSEGAEASGTLKLTRGEIIQVEGTLTAKAELAGAALKSATARGPKLVLDAQCNVSGTLPTEVAVDMTGTLNAPDYAGVKGTVKAKAWWRGGQLVVNDGALDTPAFKAFADVTRSADGVLAAHVREATLNGDGIAWATAYTPLAGKFSAGGKQAKLTVTELLAGLESGKPPRLVQGDVAFSGIDLRGVDAPIPLTGIRGAASIEENVIHLSELDAGGIKASGTLTPSFDTGAVRFDLAASAALNDTLLASIYPVESVSGLGGALEMKRVAGTWRPGDTLPPDLVAEGALRDGKAKLKFSDFEDQLTAASATFSTDAKGVNASFKATSNQAGPVSGKGRFDLAEQTWVGTAAFDAARAAKPFLPEGESGKLAEAVVASYGDSVLDMTVRLPRKGDATLSLVAARQGKPELRGELRMTTGDKGTSVTMAEASTGLALDLVRAALPASTHAQGVAQVNFRARPGFTGFDADVDLTQASVGYGALVEKRAGDALVLHVQGTKSAAGMEVAKILVDCLGQSIALDKRGDAISAPDLRLALAPLVPLLPAGAKASGQVTGSVTLADTLAAALVFDQAAFTLPSGIKVDSLSGKIQGSGDTWSCENLKLLGLNSDATVKGRLEKDVFTAEVNGKQLDANAFLAMYEAMTGKTVEKPASGTPAPKVKAEAAPLPYTGNATVNVENILYRRGTIKDLRAKVKVTPGVIASDEFFCRPNTGAVNGTMRLELATAKKPANIAVKADFQNADMGVVDAMVFDPPRGVAGTATGTVDIQLEQAPVVGTFSGLNGEIAYAARDGSYGEFGMATSLLKVLRTTQVLQLSKPKLGQNGLVFQESNAKFVIRDGVLTIDRFDLKEASYALSAEGYVNYPKDDMNAVIRANLFDSVTGIVGIVPGLRRATEQLREQTALKISLTGSPSRPRVREEHGAGVLNEGQGGATPPQAGAITDGGSPAPGTTAPQGGTKQPTATTAPQPTAATSPQPAVTQPPTGTASTPTGRTPVPTTGGLKKPPAPTAETKQPSAGTIKEEPPAEKLTPEEILRNKLRDALQRVKR